MRFSEWRNTAREVARSCWRDFLVGLFFIVSLGVYLRYKEINFSSYKLFNHPELLQYGWLLFWLGLSVCVYCGMRYVPLLRVWLTARRYSLLELYGFFWLTALLGTIITLGMFGVSASEILKHAAVIVGKITSVFLVYGVGAVLLMSIGYRLLQLLRLRIEYSLFYNLVTLSLGMSITILFFYGASLAGILSLQLFWVWLVTIFLVGWTHIKSLISNFSNKRLQLLSAEKNVLFRSMLLCLGIIWFVVLFSSVGLPYPVSSDDLRAYYTLPKTFIEEGRIVAFPYFSFNNAPHLATFLYIPILYMGSFFLNYFNLFLYTILLLTVYYGATRIAGRASSPTSTSPQTAGIWAIVLFGLMPWHYFFVTTSKIDYLASFFIVLAVLCIYEARLREQYRTWYALAGAILGVAVGIKFTTLLIFPVLVPLLLLWNTSKKLSQGMFRVGIVLCFAGIMCLPWAIRNTIVWGNPLYPFAQFIHESAREKPNNSVTAFDSNEQQFLDKKLSELHGRYVHGVSHSYPWWHNVWQFFIGRSTYNTNYTGPIFFVLAPLAFLGLFHARIRPLLILSLGVFLIWYWISIQQQWYILYIFGFLAIAYGVQAPLLHRHLQRLILTVLMFIFFLTLITYRIEFARYLLPKYTSRDVMARHHSVDLVDYLNETLAQDDPHYVIWPMAGTIGNAYIDQSHRHLYIAGAIDSIGSGRLSNSFFMMAEHDASKLLQALRSAHITHVYYSTSSNAYWADFYCGRELGFCFHSYVKENFKRLEPYLLPVYTDVKGASIIYKIMYESL